MTLQHSVSQDEENKTVLYILKNKLGLSSRLIKKLKKHEGKLLLNDNPVFTNAVVKQNDVVKVILEFDEVSLNIIPEPMELDILYEDAHFIAINKPPQMVIHPTYNYPHGTLANGLSHYFLSKGEKCLIRPVSRLDKDTSGIVLFGKNAFFPNYLSKQSKFSGKTQDEKFFIKKYYGIVYGVFNPPSGKIELPIKRVEGSTIERTISNEGDYALTLYKTIDNLNLNLPDAASLVEFELVTGRTHQIRVHCMYSGHPLMGETLYNKDLKGNPLDLTLNGQIKRQLLHSREVSFIHPVTRSRLSLTAGIPADMEQIIQMANRQNR